MPIDPKRISTDIEAIAAFTEAPPQIGYSRPTFSPSWRKARDYIAAQAQAAGCTVRIDAAGNLHARPTALPPQQPVWLSGSHVDSVPTGGKFDGVAGIVAPLEILRAARQDGQQISLELIIFAEEEGTTFSLGMLGSRAWVGDLTHEPLAALKNPEQQNYFQAGEPHGVRFADLGSERFNPAHYLGLVEIHIEQGLSLWNAGKPLAIVTAIAGRKQYRVIFEGVPNHAGSTSMEDRQDALAASAEVVLQIEAMAKQLSSQTVATVGRIACHPNAVNVIPGKVEFTVDFRSPDDGLLVDGDGRLRCFVTETAESRKIKWHLEMTENQPAIALDSALCSRLQTAAGDVPITSSGALHDAAIMAPFLPTAMIFIASRDGISHNPIEYSRTEDIAAAAQVLYDTIRS